jgi:hypothetical protein
MHLQPSTFEAKPTSRCQCWRMRSKITSELCWSTQVRGWFKYLPIFVHLGMHVEYGIWNMHVSYAGWLKTQSVLAWRCPCVKAYNLHLCFFRSFLATCSCSWIYLCCSGTHPKNTSCAHVFISRSSHLRLLSKKPTTKHRHIPCLPQITLS